MPAEIGFTPTKYVCSPTPRAYAEKPTDGRRCQVLHPQLQDAIARVHANRAAAERYYDQATEILWRGGLSRIEFRVWVHVCEGRGWPAIKAATGLTKYRIVTVIAWICARFDLPPPT